MLLVPRPHPVGASMGGVWARSSRSATSIASFIEAKSCEVYGTKLSMARRQINERKQKCHVAADSSYLGIDDLKDVQEELIDVSNKWYNIGLQLNLQPGDLDNIKLTEHVDVRSCLCEMLKSWLKRVHPSPTWQLLVKALSSRSVSEADLAKRMKEKYCRKNVTAQLPIISMLHRRRKQL